MKPFTLHPVIPAKAHCCPGEKSMSSPRRRGPRAWKLRAQRAVLEALGSRLRGNDGEFKSRNGPSAPFHKADADLLLSTSAVSGQQCAKAGTQALRPIPSFP